jgi:hypothetical protein
MQFSQAEYAGKKKQTQQDKLLAEMQLHTLFALANLATIKQALLAQPGCELYRTGNDQAMRRAQRRATHQHPPTSSSRRSSPIIIGTLDLLFWAARHYQ